MKETRSDRRPMTSNTAARLIALVALAGATVLVARTGGASAVGIFSLLRVLPWLLGAVASQGLVGAAPYFLAGPTRKDRDVAPTILAIAAVTGVAGAVVWELGTPLLKELFFKSVPSGVIAAAGLLVISRLIEPTAKACAQGLNDMAGANRTIVLEEVSFLLVYALLVKLGMGPVPAIVWGLLADDVITGGQCWIRLARRGFFAVDGKPSFQLARRIARYGLSAQVGSVLTLLNDRLDFILVAAIIGPTALGVYAVASKVAELLRVPTAAIQYVLYPRYSELGGRGAATAARTMMRRAGILPIVLAAPLAAGAFLLPLVYGNQFHGAIVPTWILLGGMAGAGLSGVISAFLFADGRPGMNSMAAGAGVVVTVALDFALIPRYGIIGASIASAAAYLITTGAHLWFFRVAGRPYAEHPSQRVPIMEVSR